MRDRIDIAKLAELNKKVEENAKNATGKSPVMFVGTTGHGKSTTVNLITGVPMEVKKINGERYLRAKEKATAEIGEDIGSKTLLTQIIEHDSVTIADLPGFHDTRAPEEKICASRGVLATLAEVESVSGLGIVLDHGVITDAKLLGFRQLIDDLAQLIKEPHALSEKSKKGIFFVITKIGGDYDKQDVLDRINEFKEKLGGELANEDSQKKHALLSLMTESNVFMITKDGNAYVPGNNEKVDLNTGSASILNYLKALPKDSLAKDDFVLEKSPDAEKVRGAFAQLHLNEFSESVPPGVLPKKLAKDSTPSGDALSGITEQLHNVYQELQAMAKGYINLLEGKTSTASLQNVVSKSKLLIDLLKSPVARLSKDVVKSLLAFTKKVGEFRQNVKLNFGDNADVKKYSEIVDDLLMAQLRFQNELGIDRYDSVKSFQKKLTDEDKNIDTMTTNSKNSIAQLKTNKVNIVNNNNTITGQLTATLSTEQQNLLTIQSQGCPAVPANPGNGPAQPVAPQPPAGDRPDAPPYPWKPEKGSVDEAFRSQAFWDQYNAEWARVNGLHMARQQYDAAMQAYRTALPVYQTDQQAYLNHQQSIINYQAAVNSAAQYNQRLQQASNQVQAAQNALNNHVKNAKIAEDNADKAIKDEEDNYKRLQALKLLMSSLRKLVIYILAAPDRKNAIDILSYIQAKLGGFNDKIAKETFDQLETLIDNLKKERSEYTDLFENAKVLVDEKDQYIFDNDEDTSVQLKKISTSLHALSLGGTKLSDNNFSLLTQKLADCGEMRLLDFQGSISTKLMIARLIPVLSRLPKLRSLDLSDNPMIDDETGEALLKLVKSHKGLMSVNLTNTSCSSKIIHQINGVLALRQLGIQKSEQYDGFLDSYRNAMGENKVDHSNANLKVSFGLKSSAAHLYAKQGLMRATNPQATARVPEVRTSSEATINP